MKFAKIKMVALTALVAIGASGCASTDPSEKYNYEPRVLPVITVDAEWDDSKSYAMNKLIQMGYEPNVVDAVDLKDSAHTYSGGERFLSGALSYMGVGLMGALADASQTKKINEEAARIPYTALLDVPEDVLEADTPQQQFIQVRDYVASKLISAYSLVYDDVTHYMTASHAGRMRPNAGIVYYTASDCNPVNQTKLSADIVEIGYDFTKDPHSFEHGVCYYTYDMAIVQNAAEPGVKVRVGFGGIWKPVIKGLIMSAESPLFVPPAIKRRNKIVVRGIPLVAESSVAHYFTLDNATEELKFTNNEEG